jgi:hypothetical protein
MLRSFLKVETCVPTFTYFFNSYWICYMLWTQTFKRSRRRTSSFYWRAIALHLLSYNSYNSSFAIKTQIKGDGLCVAVGLHSDSKQRGYVFGLFSCNLSRRVAFVQTCIFTQTPNAVYFRISVSASCNSREEKLFVTWVSTVTPKRQELLWCRCGFSSVAALKVSMDCHILFELDSDTTDEVRHVLL